MWRGSILGLFLVLLTFTSAQLPPRFQVPGAVLAQGSRPSNLRQQRINALNTDFIPRSRRPSPISAPFRDVRPVIEEEEENYPISSAPSISSFDAEVNKLSIPAITTAIRQTEEEDIQQSPQPSPTPFRPEKPIPITREQIRDKSISDFPVQRQPALPISRGPPVVKHDSRPLLRPVRPIARQELDDEEENIPRQPIRPKIRPQTSQLPVQQYRPTPRPKHLDDDELERKRRPVVQILRKYRTDNEDGSITWGFENEDGTFKEETLGTDCVISGKYGYVDPDGVKREFTYEAGNKCDPNQLDEEELEEEIRSRPPPPKKPVASGPIRPQVQPQIQYRPQLAQY